MMKIQLLPPSLIYVSDTMPGYSRSRTGDQFIYHDDRGKVITDEKILNRISKLAIPPMWEQVWISKNARGHIQATGRDARGRKQYVYHPRWNKSISEQKYDSLLNFGLSLPGLREKLEKALRKRKWDKEKVVALAIRLMDELYLRVGNKQYEAENGTYGLTTLRKKHLKKHKDGLILKYTAKSGKLRKVTVRDLRLQRLLRQCSELPGYEIFRYRSDEGFYPISSQDINEYLYETSGEHYTAKTFRTWGGTVLAVRLEPQARAICAEYPKRKFETTLVRLVAGELNNTVAVCRKYYIHPLVLEIALSGKLEDYRKMALTGHEHYSAEEKIVLQILEDAENLKKQNDNGI